MFYEFNPPGHLALGRGLLPRLYLQCTRWGGQGGGSLVGVVVGVDGNRLGPLLCLAKGDDLLVPAFIYWGLPIIAHCLAAYGFPWQSFLCHPGSCSMGFHPPSQIPSLSFQTGVICLLLCPTHFIKPNPFLALFCLFLCPFTTLGGYFPIFLYFYTLRAAVIFSCIIMIGSPQHKINSEKLSWPGM